MLFRRIADDQWTRPVDPEELSGWTVRDVVAHVVGIAADLNAGRFGSGSADDWAAEQVRSRKDRSVDELSDEWDLEAPRFEDGLRLFGYELGGPGAPTTLSRGRLPRDKAAPALSNRSNRDRVSQTRMYSPERRR